MGGPLMPLPPSLPPPSLSLPEVLPLLPAWMARQRWYTGKGHIPILRIAGALRLQDPGGQVDIDIHLLVDESGQTPTTYQVPLTCRSTRLAGADGALVATMEPADHGGESRYVYDAPHDPAYARALLALMLEEGTATSTGAHGPDGTPGCGADGHRLTTTDPGELHASRVLTGEQSNTSIIIDLVDTLGDPAEPLICKVFRVLQPGQNPDVVVQSALSAAGSALVPDSVGYVCGQWQESADDDSLATGHLAYAQEFLPGVEDAWRVALAALASGTDFTTEARSLGHATAEVHASLAQAMGTRQATRDDVSALKRSMRSRHAAAVSEVPAIAAYDKLVRASIDAVTSASWPALQRIHGDYHLGQVLNAPGRGWVLVDFEGEPLRPLAERNQLDLALRDVAGMLRSFDYVAGSWEQDHRGRSGAQWAAAARTAFLEGYAAGAGRDPRQDAILLNALELDKALYEVVYEARNRPTWLGIPTTAIARIARLSEGPRSDLRP